MFITEDLLMLNFPKTGSTFAREVLRRVYSKRDTLMEKTLVKLGLRKPSVIDLLLPQIDVGIGTGLINQHGTVRQIPPIYQDRPIVTITRNPLSRYVSTYLFRSWVDFPPADVKTLKKTYPNYPDLSFSEYYEMMHTYEVEKRLNGIKPKIELGVFTIQFIRFYFKDPEAILKKIDLDYIENKEYINELSKIHFIKQENLNSELKEFLQSVGMTKDELSFMDSMDKINVSKQKEDKSSFNEYYLGTDVEQKILDRDRLLFSIFPDYLPENQIKEI